MAKKITPPPEIPGKPHKPELYPVPEPEEPYEYPEEEPAEFPEEEPPGNPEEIPPPAGW